MRSMWTPGANDCFLTLVVKSILGRLEMYRDFTKPTSSAHNGPVAPRPWIPIQRATRGVGIHSLGVILKTREMSADDSKRGINCR
jgi:hypothetical protein